MISISSILFSPTDKFKIQMSITLNNNEYNNLINTFETDRGVYISINPNIVVIMKYCPMNNRKWERTDNIYITITNIYPLRAGLLSFYKKIMREDIFIYNTKGYVEEINLSRNIENDIEVIPLTKGQFLRLEPAIIYDKQGNSLPGVMMRINSESNEVDLSMEEYEAMMNMFESINIRQEGFLLLQTYLMIRKKPIDQNDIKAPQTGKYPESNRSIFDRSNKSTAQQEFVKSPIIKKNEFMNLPVNEMNEKGEK